MNEKLSPAEALGNLTADEKGHIQLKPVAVVEGKKYTLFNEESGRAISNNIKVKPENVEKYVYVPSEETPSTEDEKAASDTSIEAASAGLEGPEQVRDRPIDKLEKLARGEPIEELEEHGEETPSEEVSEEPAGAEEESKEEVGAKAVVPADVQKRAETELKIKKATAELTASVRSYFRTFVGVNPENIAKNAPEIVKQFGEVGLLNITGYFIGTYAATRIASAALLDNELKSIQSKEDLFKYMLSLDKETGRSKIESIAAEAYMRLGYDKRTANYYAKDWVQTLSRTNAWGMMAAIEHSGSSRGLYNMVSVFFNLKKNGAAGAKLLSPRVS